MEQRRVIPLKEKMISFQTLASAPSDFKSFAHYAQYWLQKENLTDVSFLDGSEQALFCVRDAGFKEVPVGIVVWFEDEDEDCWWVQIAYVHEDHRKQGILTRMLEELRGDAKSQGVPLITVGTHVNNKPMQEALSKFGAVNEYQIWNITL